MMLLRCKINSGCGAYDIFSSADNGIRGFISTILHPLIDNKIRCFNIFGGKKTSEAVRQFLVHGSEKK